MRRLALALLLTAAAGALTACDRQPTARVDEPAATIEAVDYRLRPQHLSVPAGKVTLTLDNTGRVPHNLQVRRGEERVLLRIATVLPGATGTASARLRPGRYELVSTVARDEQLGQRGTLTVR
jgi:hypothetical protein